MLANLGGDDDDSAEVASESAQETADDSAGADEASGEESAADGEASTSVAEDSETLYETAPESPAGGSADTDSAAAGEGSTARTGTSLGTFNDGAALHDHVRQLLGDSSPTPGTSGASDGAQCASVADGSDDPAGGVALPGWAVLAGQEVRVTVIERGDGSRTLTVADPAPDCADLPVPYTRPTPVHPNPH